MILTAFLTGLFVFIAGLSVLLILLRVYSREKRRFIATIKLYFEPAGPDQQSQFAQVTEAISKQFASSIVSSAKGSLLGMQSVDARNIQRLQSDITMDLAQQQSPMLGMILKQFPSAAKRLQKNPELMPYVAEIMGKFSSPGGPVKDENHDNGQSSFKGVY